MRPKAKKPNIGNSLKSRLKIPLILSTLILLCSCSVNRSAVSWPEENTENESSTFHSIPLYKAGKLILVKGEVNGKHGYLIFDTGAPGLVLNDHYFKNCKADPSRQVTGVNGQIHPARVITASNLKLGNLGFKRQLADVMDLSHIEEKRNVKILGLMGVSLLQGEELEIDLQKKVLRVFKTDKNGLRMQPKVAAENKGLITVPFRYSGHLIELEAKINNRPYRIAFDTGSEILLFDKYALLKDKIQTSILKKQELLSTGGSSSGIEIRELGEIDLGVILKKVTTVAVDLKSLRGFGLYVDGFIGYDLMASGVVTINFKKRIVQIQPFPKAQ